MKLMRTTFLTGALLLNACGEEEKTYTGSLGACSVTTELNEVSGTYCTDYTYTAKDTKDPKADSQSTLEMACAVSEGTFSTTACDQEGATSKCTFTEVSGKATVTGTTFYSGTLYESEELVTSACEAQGGTAEEV
jgi:hypothetical protein